MPKEAQVTSADVAVAAGVSRATVSFVLNDTPSARVSDATRERVLAAARELGYVPHAAARSLRAGRSDIVLLPIPVFAIGRLFSDWLGELEAAFGSLGYRLMLIGDHSEDPLAAARSWAQLRPAAVLAIAAGRMVGEVAGVLAHAGIQTLTVAEAPVEGVLTFVHDQSLVGVTAVEHLVARGRRRIGVVMPAERGLSVLAEARLVGARRAAGAAEIVPLPMRYTDSAAAALAVLGRELDLDAVFGFNDEYAALLIAALGDAGITVPDRIAVVGADDLVSSQVVRPRLTSIRYVMPPASVFADAVDRLIQREEIPEIPPVRFELVPRDSS
ncbi:LacI family DNA-binding transcriptional regulator [Cryptosporangium aurantiacum]|uniref:Transcriptional regulator, LacI family n=1 Tax=Cryptosporangium aurantiacum TaxID=134849 RepID=A0A1M7PP20_9ACTN|nr:LacI family DNA-binding transcriptional regulator [Cryptosporangium aurantiacum]SHN19066.1 transcriptional regulator, LacI family [Cryptosporangium aurantiacum]